MKIVFKNKYNGTLDVYIVNNVCYDTDNNGIPVDIFIECPEDTANEIADKHCALGYNYSEEYQCALFGRLENFYII